MGMFGQRKPAFGQIPGMQRGPYDTPPIWGGPPQDEPMGQVGAMDPNTQAMTKKPGFFAPGQAGRHIVGFIGDALQRIGGGEGTYIPHMMQMQQQDAEIRARLQEAIAKRKAEREDYTWKAEYDRANPKPINNDTVNDLNWYKGLTEEDRKLYHQMKPVTGLRADGTPYAYNPYELNQPRGPVTPPPEAINDLKNNPATAAQFDEIFGPGAAARALGGQVSPAPATFQPRL